MAINLEQFKLTPQEQTQKLRQVPFEQFKTKQTEQPEQKFSFGKMLGNIIPSAGEFVKGAASAITHPIKTISGLGQVGAGAIQSIPVVSEMFSKRAAQTGKTELLESNKQAFQNVKDYFVERYGGIDNILKSIEEDPVGVAIDVSALTGGAGKLLKGTKVAKPLSTISRLTDPINIASKSIKTAINIPKKIMKTLGAESLGVTTGAGGEAIRTAVSSAKAGSKEFTQALRGKISQQDVLTYAKQGLRKLKSERGAEYIKALSKLEDSNKVLNFAPIKSKIVNKLNNFKISVRKNGSLDFTKSAIADSAEQTRISKLMKEALTWKDNTVIGLDTLKRRLGDFRTISNEGLALKTSVEHLVKDLVSKEVPAYKAMISDYSVKSTLINELSSTLSLKEGASIDTALTKLSSAIKRDHTFRRELLQTLDAATKQDIAGQVAGSLLNPTVPSGLIGRSIFAGGPVAALLTGSLSPTLFSSLLFASPRVVGEFLNALGISQRYASNIMEFLQRMKVGQTSSTATKSLFQLGRLNLKSENK